MSSDVLVIIPTYDRPSLCKRAIGSLVAQDFEMWDAVILKNKGTHRLQEYVGELGDFLDHPRISMCVVPGSGLAYALNQACRHFLTGHEYFASLEDDDEWDPGFLRVMANELDCNSNVADVVHCLQRQEPMPRQSDGGKMDKDEIRRHNWINWPMCMWKAKVWRGIGGFCEDVGPAVDWDTHLRALARGFNYRFVNNTLVTHHWHGGNYCLEVEGKGAIMKRMERGIYK